MKGTNSSLGVSERISRSAAEGGSVLRCVVNALSVFGVLVREIGV